MQLLGALVIIAWASVWSCLVFACLKWFNILRIQDYDEHFGLDLTHHGESAYPAEAWIEMQYERVKMTAGVRPRIGPMQKQQNNEPNQRTQEIELRGVGFSNNAKAEDNALDTPKGGVFRIPSVTKPGDTGRSSKLTSKFS